MRPARDPWAQSLTILGATGSVGRATLTLVAEQRARLGPEAFRIEALTGGRNVAALAEAARAFRPRFVAIADPDAGPALRAAIDDPSVAVGAGPAAVIEAAERPSDLVVAGIVGAAGLPAVLAAARRGASVALANKEALVCAGALLTAATRAGGGRLLPIDSEHNGVFEAIDGRDPAEIEGVTLTASGGPFRTWSREAMAAATPAAAVAHPTWSMGAKISVDSATLMNKGLELIEAHHLFALPPERLGAVIHPQSIVHAIVTFRDGAALAHLSCADMAVPIARALGWPGRLETATRRLDWAALGALTFEPPDLERFPALGLARAALACGGGAPLVLNAANEVAVEAFLAGRIGFLGIAGLVEAVLSAAEGAGLTAAPGDIAAVFEADAAVRRLAGERLGAHVSGVFGTAQRGGA